MPLTFDTLRERNNQELQTSEAKLLEKEAALSSATQNPETRQIRASIGRSRKRMEKLLDHRTDIENLASSGPQRTEYGNEEGAEKWHSDFTLVRDIHSIPGVRFLGEDLEHYIWSQVPHSRFKQFQELFVGPEHFAVPQFDVLPGGKIRFPQANFDTMSLSGCLVSADRIPDHLAESLKLCDFTEDKGNPFARLQKKALAIPQLKKIWESSVQLQPKHHRLCVIKEPSDTVQNKYPDIEGPDPAIIGSMFYVREYQNGQIQSRRRKGTPPAPRQLQVHHYESVYAAQRKTGREESSYDNEMKILTEIGVKVEQLKTRVSTQWTDTSLRPDLREQAEDIGDTCAHLLQNSVTVSKIEAREFSEKFASLKDATGRENAMAALTQMVAVVTRIQQRFTDMNVKGSFNQRDQDVLKTHIAKHEAYFQEYRASVVAAAERPWDTHELFDATVSMTDRQREHNVTTFEHQLNLAPSTRLSEITLQPFTTYQSVLEHQYQQLQAALRSRNKEAAISHIVAMHIVGKFQEVRRCFEDMKVATMDTHHSPVTQMRSFVTKLLEVFARRQIFSDTTVTSHEEPFVEMLQKLRAIEKRLREYEATHLSTDEMQVMYEKLKKYLDTFDLESIVKSLDSHIPYIPHPSDVLEEIQ